MKIKKMMFLGYCPKCGRDVVADFCDECKAYTQEPVEEEECPSTRTSVKRTTPSKSTLQRSKKLHKVQRVQKRVVDDRPERFPR